MLSIFAKGGIWRISVWGERVNLSLPMPMYVFADIIDSMADLCAVVLPWFGLPNYAVLLGELFEALGAASGEPLLTVDARGVRVRLARDLGNH